MLGQYVINGLLIGGLYACLAVGFSLVWGVLNVINMMHGSMVVLGAYFCLYGVQQLGLPLYTVAPAVCVLLFLFGYVIQRGFLNSVMTQPILITLEEEFEMAARGFKTAGKPHQRYAKIPITGFSLRSEAAGEAGRPDIAAE